MVESLQGGAEDNVLTMLVWSDKHAATIAATLPSSTIFSTRYYQKIAKAAIDYVTRFGHPPQGHIADLLERDVRQGDEGKYLLQTIRQMEQMHTEMHADYVMETLDKFIRIRHKTMALNKAYDALQSGEEELADELYWQGQVQAPKRSPGLWLHDTDLSFMQNIEADFFSSGVEELDRRGIRPERGTQTVLIGPKKSGKSWWCINLGKAALQYGHTCLHVTLENSAALTKRRYLQSLWAMSKRDVQQLRIASFQRGRHGMLEDISFETLHPLALTMSNKAEILRKLDTLTMRPRVLIKEFPSGVLTVAHLKTFLDQLEREGFVPDLLIVDYPRLMRLRPENLRLDLGDIFVQLRGIAVDRNIALCCPMQGNRSSDGAKVVGSRMIAEDWSITGTADTILTFCQTPEEKQGGLARLLVDAARDEEDKFMVLVSQSYATGQFCIDSVMYGKYMEPHLDRATGADRANEADDEEDEQEHGE